MSVHRLPEEIVYRDTGCSVHPACLSCPLPVCRHDLTGLFGGRPNELNRALLVGKMRAEGKAVGEIAALIGTTKRSVYRNLRAYEQFQGRTE